MDELFDYDDYDMIDTLYMQYNNVILKKDFYDLKSGTNLAWFACNFETNEYSYAYRSEDGPDQWLRGKIQVTFGEPS